MTSILTKLLIFSLPMLTAVEYATPLNAQGSDSTATGIGYELHGVTVYDSSEILGFAAHVVADRTGSVTAGGIAQTVEAMYREDGYFLAEATVASDGRTIVVNEGEIGSVSIEGVDEQTFRLIRAYFSPVVGRKAVNMREFERAIMLVEDIEAVSATAEVEYLPGETVANVRVLATPEDRNSGWITLDHPSREFGDAAVLTFNQEFLSALTTGDLLRFYISATESFDGSDGTLYGAVNYRMPLGGKGTFGEIYLGNVAAYRDASGTLLETDIEGNTAILALGHPVLRDVERYGYALLELRQSGSSDDVGGTTFESDVNVVGASWIYGRALSGGGALEYAANLSAGTRTTDANGFDDGDEDFWHFRGGVGYQKPVNWFGENSTIRAELWGQYSNDRLPSIEEFYLGGIDAERGFVFAEAQGDSGVSASVELGRDFFPNHQMLRRIRPFGFFDAGYITNNNPSASELDNETLASVGLGVDAEFGNGFYALSYVAVPTTSGPSTSSGDPAFYLSITKTW